MDVLSCKYSIVYIRTTVYFCSFLLISLWSKISSSIRTFQLLFYLVDNNHFPIRTYISDFIISSCHHDEDNTQGCLVSWENEMYRTITYRFQRKNNPHYMRKRNDNMANLFAFLIHYIDKGRSIKKKGYLRNSVEKREGNNVHQCNELKLEKQHELLKKMSIIIKRGILTYCVVVIYSIVSELFQVDIIN